MVLSLCVFPFSALGIWVMVKRALAQQSEGLGMFRSGSCAMAGQVTK